MKSILFFQPSVVDFTKISQREKKFLSLSRSSATHTTTPQEREKRRIALQSTNQIRRLPAVRRKNMLARVHLSTEKKKKKRGFISSSFGELD